MGLEFMCLVDDQEIEQALKTSYSYGCSDINGFLVDRQNHV